MITMKTRKYTVEKIEKGSYFCPNCHRELALPFKGNINIQGGLSLMCSNCKNGKILIAMPEKNTEVITDPSGILPSGNPFVIA